jgi:DNA-binding PadR family transcriptional regulator
MRHGHFDEAGHGRTGADFGDRLRARVWRRLARHGFDSGPFGEGTGPAGPQVADRIGKEEFEARGERGMGRRQHGFGRDSFRAGIRAFRERAEGRMRPLEQGDLRWLTLDLLAEQPRHGYDIIKAIEEAFNGHYAPSPGAIYPMLTLLEETGLIESETQGAKKLYRVTEAGRAEVAAQQQAIDAARGRLKESSQRFGGVPAPEIMRAMDNLRAALRVRLAKDDLAGEALARVTAALDRAASDIERS